ncbi:Glycerophosphoryl diester phosphodiesterase [Martensiomyces pterosporus]|nr:Glycerophosphoryl diester phosphodiesterase [Martensiomyces pterosporus]
MNVAPESRACRLQLGENTVLSMEQAVKDGAFAVEFDVQLTRDMAPVIYHDWNVSETGMDIPVNALTLSQFLSHGPRSKRLSRSRSCSSLGEATSSSSSSGAAASMANSASTVQAPFATLRDLFESLPESVGFDIEIKYPMADEADEAGVCTSFEMNLFVDQILDVVLSYTSPPHLASSALPPSRRRPIVFTSFHPDICLLLAHKVSGRFPIMLLTDAGMSRMADCRCNSLNAAVKLCKWMGLSGIVSHVSPIAESPRVAFLVRRHELALGTYGKLNNQARYVRLQKLYGVDVVIADDVPAALAALSPAAGAARPVA